MVISRENIIIRPSLVGGTEMTALVTGGAVTGYSAPLDVGNFTEIIAFANVTAASGTLDISFEFSADQKNWAASGDAFTQITTSTGVTFKRLTANFGKYIRVKFVTASNPNYTWSLALACKG